ncbi:MAG: hypothetical protein HQ516_05095 [Chlorobium sp.]|nr:hypothetical protein [Chlorobium sp.]
MEFLTDTFWWLTAAIAACAASLPAITRSLRLRTVVPAALIWTGALIATLCLSGPFAAIATSLLSSATGAILLGTVIFFSGIKGMANKRYR